MGNPVLATPNHIFDTFSEPIVGGGSWESTQPISNVKDKFFINNSISTNLLTTSTTFDVDFTITQNVKIIAIPKSNASPSATVRVRASTEAAWTGATIDGVNAENATTINIDENGATPMAGEVITIAGDPVGYTITTAVVGQLTIVRNDGSGTGLSQATVGGELISCRSGDLNDTIYDSGVTEYFPVIYPALSLPWGSAGVWDGKISQQQLDQLGINASFVIVIPGTVFARYWRVDIDDTMNTTGSFQLDSLYMASAFIPRIGASYGAQQSIRSNSRVQRSVGGVQVSDRQPSQRQVSFRLDNLTVENSFVNIFDNQARLDITEPLFFLFDIDDTTLLYRRSFPGYFETLDPITYNFFDSNSVQIKILEQLA